MGEKKNGIVVLRGILCILVVISHSGLFFPADGKWGWLQYLDSLSYQDYVRACFPKMTTRNLLLELLG